MVGGGRIAWDDLRALRARGYAIIAADGAADTLRDEGLMPDAIIGDLDSLSSRDGWAGVEIIHVPEQDTTDFEKCLYSTDAPLYFGFGLIGKRVDHTLAAFHVLHRYAAEKALVLIDEIDVVMPLIGPFSLDVGAGTRVSLYPLARLGFDVSSGLKYPLEDFEMEPGIAIGVSNEALADRVSWTPDDVSVPYLLIMDKQWLYPLIDWRLKKVSAAPD
ncbi:MAG: thiamine diphosphokinase [Pseudomonadota bacterium]